TTLCLATKSPIVIAPAMNHVMWDNISVQENKKTLQKRGVQVIDPEFGEQACGEIGFGRMPEPLAIVDFLFNQVIDIDAPLKGKKIMITAGPTREAIDPVRYISNRSSGKMGYALASEFIEKGADVLLVTGPTNLTVPKRITSIAVESAKEMHKAVHDNIVGVDIFVSSAAVSDYRTENTYKKKIKKKNEKLTLNLVKSPDILASVSNMKQSPFSVGFAAETENLKEYALDKLNQKSLDLIIANEVGPHKGFDQDENAVHVFWKHGEKVFEKLQKRKLAKHLVELIAERFLNKDQESDSTLSNVTSIR
ncbi:MAG: bifunctional phosphopantothenoylcysteine decarboxylase/phosphopantothenate--cysteine ligase CoaBC, partial [Pseudomonadota bacterium]|nr:bifunctional phosphopantothenoylcysteine decarboxylase/phosphopantothenate--cysteine ligase CoaBC [Pseudomonadota bacterium]